MKEYCELEFEKCKNNPYYFATTYLTIENKSGEKVKFTTALNEKQFNNYFKMKEDVILQK